MPTNQFVQFIGFIGSCAGSGKHSAKTLRKFCDYVKPNIIRVQSLAQIHQRLTYLPLHAKYWGHTSEPSTLFMISVRLRYSRYHVLVLIFGLLYILYDFFIKSKTTSNSSSPSLHRTSYTSSSIDLYSRLTAIPSGQETTAWTDNDGSSQPFVVLGSSPAKFVKFDDSWIVDVTTG